MKNNSKFIVLLAVILIVVIMVSNTSVFPMRVKTMGTMYTLIVNAGPCHSISGEPSLTVQVSGNNYYSSQSTNGACQYGGTKEVFFFGLPAGDYTITVSKPYFSNLEESCITRTETHWIEGRWESDQVTVPFILEVQNSFILTVTTSPADADVSLYHNYPRINTLISTINSGTTGAIFTNLVTVAPGTATLENYNVKATKPGYSMASATIGTMGTDRQIALTLAPIPPTYDLYISTVPTDCSVTVSGRGTYSSGASGVAVFESLDLGSYTVTVVKTGYISQTTTVTIGGDQYIAIVLNAS